MKKTVLMLPAFFTFFILTGCMNLGKKATFNGVDLYHTADVSDTLANSLGNYLVSEKFADGNEKTVQLTKSGDVYHFRMVVKKGIDKDTSLTKSFKFFVSEMSSRVFNSAPVEIELCDDQMTALKTIPSDELGKMKMVKALQLYHTKAITDAQVDSLSSYLIGSKFANDREKSAQITKSGNTYQFRMVVKSGFASDAAYIKNAKVYAADLSRDVFGGSPVEIHLCDDYLNTLVVVPMEAGAK